MSEWSPITQTGAFSEGQAELYRQLVEDTSSLICTFLPDSKLTFVNAAYARFFDKRPEELAGRKFLDLIPSEEDRRAIRARFTSLTPKERAVTYEQPILALGGEECWQRWAYRAFFDDNGHVLYYQGTGEDISELHQREHGLALYRTALESTVEAVFLTNGEGNIVWINRGLTTLTGYTLEEAAGCNPREVFKSGHQDEAHYRELWKTIRSGETWRGDVVNRRKDGSLYHAEETITPVRGLKGEITHFVSVLHDITGRLRILEALRDSEERFRTLVQEARDAIFVLSVEGNLVSLNPAAERITGIPREDMLGEHFLTIVHPDDHARTIGLFDRTVQGELPAPFEIRVRHATGDYIPMECMTTPQYRKERIVGVMGVARDIRDRRALEEQVRQLQKLDSIGRLTAGIAHDFNNMLTVQEGYLSLLCDDPEMPDRFRPNLREVALATDRAARLTRQLLLFSRKQVMDARSIDLGEMVHNLSKMLARIIGEHIVLEIHCSENPPPVRADAGMLEQVIFNLSINARDAMPEGGRLALTVDPVRLDARDTGRHPEARPGCFLRLTVSDTGHGMTPDTLEHAFEPFFTTKETGKGTGLGLSTTYGVIKQHEGWIEVTSRPEKGTTFTIHLPVDTGDAAPSASRPILSAEERSGNETVLLVEDDPAVLEMVRLILSQQGYRVLTAESGTMALEQWKAHAGVIDLLLTDMVLRGGLSGNDLAKRLIAEKPNLKVLLVSGYHPESVDASESRSRFVFLQKPCPPQELLQAVRESLSKP